MVADSRRSGLMYLVLARYRRDTVFLLLSTRPRGPLIASFVELYNSLPRRCRTEHTLDLDWLPTIHRLEVLLLLA